MQMRQLSIRIDNKICDGRRVGHARGQLRVSSIDDNAMALDPKLSTILQRVSKQAS